MNLLSAMKMKGASVTLLGRPESALFAMALTICQITKHALAKIPAVAASSANLDIISPDVLPNVQALQKSV